ncbi:MAG: hypothetical protein VXZ08_03810, partial [Verrucomicrobiota bacterium]|nr:hypothetical protein [Verrucomicrobiota bacterium]
MPQKNPKFAFTLLLSALLSLCGIITPLNGDDNASLRGELLERFQQKLSASEEVTETLVVAAPEGTAEEEAAETEVFTPT